MIGSWYGIGSDRGIGLLFSLTGIIGLLVTIAAMRTPAFHALSARYRRREEQAEQLPQPTGDVAIAAIPD